MGKQSGLLARQRARDSVNEKLVRDVIGQFDLDTAILALSEVYGFGYERQVRFLAAWQKIREEDAGALLVRRDPEADVKQEHLDKALREIMRRAKKEHDFMPFRERYPMLMEISYERK